MALLMMAVMPMAAQDKTLTILHTNDTHSCIYPLNPNLSDTVLAGRGGFIRRIEMLKQERKKDPDMLLFDSGDFSQGSPYYTLYKGEVELKLMNRMGYDAGTIGNHEFDFGMENLAFILRNLRFPIVCTNYDFTGTPCEGLVKPYLIIRRKGIKIGVFGLSPALDGLVDAQKCKGVRYLDPVKTAYDTARMLKCDKKCDLVICISHLGWLDGSQGEKAVIAGSRYVDLVLGGHSHSYFKTLMYAKNLDGKEIPEDQNGKHAVFVGKLKLSFVRKK